MIVAGRDGEGGGGRREERVGERKNAMCMKRIIVH